MSANLKIVPPPGTKPIPHSAEAERAVIGCVIDAGAGALAKVRWLRPRDFHLPGHRMLWRAALRAAEAGPVDLVTVFDALTEAEQHSSGDAIADILELREMRAHSPASLGAYARIVARKAHERDRIRLALDLAHGDDPEEAHRKLRELVPPGAVETLSTRDLLDMEFNDEWIVEGLIRPASLTLLAGMAKVGKSTVSRQMAFAVGSGPGKWWLGFGCRPGSVLYAAVDERPREFQQHIKAMESADYSGERVTWIGAGKPASWDDIEAAARALRPDLLIVDTLGRALGKDVDFNDYAAALGIMERPLRLAEDTGAAVVLVHHSRKNQGGEAGAEVLGSTGLVGGVDSFVSLRRNNGSRTLYAEGRGIKPVPALEIVLSDDGLASADGSVADNKRRDIERDILDYLDAEGEARWSAMHQHIEARRNATIDAMRRLVDDERIAVTGAGTKASPKIVRRMR